MNHIVKSLLNNFYFILTDIPICQSQKHTHTQNEILICYSILISYKYVIQGTFNI